MPDRSFLSWPFFEDRHRALAEHLEAWCCNSNTAAHSDNVDDQCRRLVGELARGGWLRHASPDPADPNGRHDVRTLCLIRETLARHSGLADFAFAMQGLGGGPIALFGSKEIKDAYLAPVREGDRIAAFALSEREAGSDVAAISTTAVADRDEFVLNGAKTFISNAGLADFYVVFARTGEPGPKGLSAFVVDAGTPGLSVPRRIETSAPHPLGDLLMEYCRVPADRLLGSPGDGFKIAMATLDVFRSTVGAAALGLARRALDEALARVSERHLFGAPLAEMQITRAKLAEMAMAIDASALLVYRAAWAKDSGGARVTREAAMAKAFATEAGQDVVDKAVQLFGGLGVVQGSVVEQLYREIRPLRIYEGATEVQMQIIAKQLLSDWGRE